MRLQLVSLLDNCRKSDNRESAKAAYREYVAGLAVPKCDEQLKHAKVNRLQLRPEIDVFEEILRLLDQVKDSSNSDTLKSIARTFIRERP